MVGRAYDFAFVDCAGLVEEGVHGWFVRVAFGGRESESVVVVNPSRWY